MGAVKHLIMFQMNAGVGADQKREGKFNHKLAFEIFDMGQKRKTSFPPLFHNNVEIKENIKA